jgi:hypothetical protein
VSDSWLAIDVATAPSRRARELRAAWEHYMEHLGSDEEGLDAGLRTAIVDSWRRSFAAGVAPTGPRLAPVVSEEDETEERWRAHPLHAAMPVIRECVTTTAESGGYLVVITDADGTLLCIEGGPAVRMRAAAEMNFAEGTSWNETGVGTNGIGVALAVDHAVQVFGPEHYLEPVQRWVCAAAPVHDPDTGEVLGAIDLTADFRTVHPASLALVATTAAAVEGRLRLELLERDSALRSRYEHRVLSSPATHCLVSPSGRPITRPPARWGPTGRLAIPPGGGQVELPSGERAFAEPVSGNLEAFVVQTAGPGAGARSSPPRLKVSFLGRDRALIEVDGRREALRPRLAEILALLCAHPEGLSPEELLAGLHGDGGRVSSVRVEVSRLRRLLGSCIEADRYRLTCAVESDVRRIEALLAAGDVRDAAAAYPGPMLPGSEAPAVVRDRARLEGWLRHSVLTADDPEALWSWVRSTGGQSDLVAWKRLLAQLPFRDPRRSQAAAAVQALRAAMEEAG